MRRKEPLLIIRNLFKSFQDPTNQDSLILKNINLHVDKNEFVAFIGPSGCGKTTLLNCIAGIIDCDRGTIFVDDTIINKDKHNVSYLMQADGLLPWRRVIDNITLPLEIKGVHKKKAQEQARILLQQFGLLGFENYYPKELSGGMRQKVALARVYLTDHDLILMDEPFSHLDALTKISLQQWFLKIWQKNRKTALMVTHDIDEAIFMADRIYVLSSRPGRIIAEYKTPVPRPDKLKHLTNSLFVSFKQELMQALDII